MAAVAKQFDVIGINNTGYGLKNFNRIKGFEFKITNPLPPQPIFQTMHSESNFSAQKMYEAFNMGMGFFIICHAPDADSILQVCKDAQIVGSVKKSQKTQTILETDKAQIEFTDY